MSTTRPNDLPELARAPAELPPVDLPELERERAELPPVDLLELERAELPPVDLLELERAELPPVDPEPAELDLGELEQELGDPVRRRRTVDPSPPETRAPLAPCRYVG